MRNRQDHRIFLADGEPIGTLLAEISNWTGKVLVAPRSQFDQLSKREEVRRTGVSLLAGCDPDDPPAGAGLHRRGRQRPQAADARCYRRGTGSAFGVCCPRSETEWRDLVLDSLHERMGWRPGEGRLGDRVQELFLPVVAAG